MLAVEISDNFCHEFIVWYSGYKEANFANFCHEFMVWYSGYKEANFAKCDADNFSLLVAVRLKII